MDLEIVGKAGSVPLPRRRVSAQSKSTRQSIILAAERLFAERGFSGVSLREIAVAAGQGNNNAVRYHFGSKDSLIEAIHAYGEADIDAERQAALEQATASGLTRDLRTLVAAIALPHLSLCDSRGHHPHARFLLHYLIRRANADAAGGHPPGIGRATRRLLALTEAACCPSLPADLRPNRIALCTIMFLNLLVRHDAAHPGGSDPTLLARQANDTIDAIVAALGGNRPAAPDAGEAAPARPEPVAMATASA